MKKSSINKKNLDLEVTSQIEPLTTRLKVRNLQKENAKLKARVVELSSQAGRFAHAVSHDLKEPLSTLSSYCEVLERLEKKNLSSEILQCLSFIREASVRSQNLIGALVEFSNLILDEGKWTEVVDCNEIIRKLIEDLMPSSDEQNKIEISCEKMPLLRGTNQELLFIFRALISNAIKFQNKSASVIKIFSEQEPKFWRFCVLDQGLGIEEKYLDQIFLGFKRLHPRGRFEGTGLSLFICKKILEKVGGRIWVESRVNEGSKFFFTWPLSSESAEHPRTLR